jgi:BASS family bile acid:Na+ symporter
MNYPGYFQSVGDFQLRILIVPLLQIIMFGMGSQLSIKSFEGVIKMPKGVLVGVICQFSIMPVIGITLATVFGFPPEIAAGVVLIGSSPSGLASNVMSFIARANLALSVTLTAVATLLAPVMTPLLMKLLAGQYVPIDVWGMMLSIINIVILPIIAGLLFHGIGYRSESRKSILWQLVVFVLVILAKNVINVLSTDATFHDQLNVFLSDIAWFLILPAIAAYLFKVLSKGNKAWLDKAMSLVSMIGIAVIITIITAAGRDSLLQIGLSLILASLIHNLAGFSLGYWLCKLLGMDEKSCRTISLEVGMQNGGLASGIALEMGKVATIGLAPAVFGPMMNITGSSLATWWRGKPVKEEKK